MDKKYSLYILRDKSIFMEDSILEYNNSIKGLTDKIASLVADIKLIDICDNTKISTFITLDEDCSGLSNYSLGFKLLLDSLRKANNEAIIIMFSNGDNYDYYIDSLNSLNDEPLYRNSIRYVVTNNNEYNRLFYDFTTKLMSINDFNNIVNSDINKLINK